MLFTIASKHNSLVLVVVHVNAVADGNLLRNASVTASVVRRSIRAIGQFNTVRSDITVKMERVNRLATGIGIVIEVTIDALVIGTSISLEMTGVDKANCGDKEQSVLNVHVVKKKVNGRLNDLNEQERI